MQWIQQPKSYLIYLNETNLFGKSLSEYLPAKDFRCPTGREKDSFDCLNISNESDKGLILEMGLESPEELTDLHNDLSWSSKFDSTKWKTLKSNIKFEW